MANGLLGFLGDALAGLGEVGAAYAATQGQPALFQMMQEQKRQQNRR